ncbi:ESS1 [Candida pseudojiufengensis]|uniref:ESS1 n=1 Tax=Candida pseudojiufengensis TaxID=497109 RepID=UPI002224E3E0|nr:ESS1 [Candida pseudojiufengensis]KAI5966551.1 ESS1 [Candida pseudojiufengensis]
MSVNTGLPPNWTIKVSKTHNKEYYLNQSTKESSWDPPYGTDKETLNSYIQKFKNNDYKPVTNKDGKVRVSHILIKNKNSRNPKSWKNQQIDLSREDAINLAKSYLNKILSGELKFSDLAQDESDCSSHSRGGDLGFFGKKEMQPPFEIAAYDLHVGEISNLVETDSGIHILQRTG